MTVLATVTAWIAVLVFAALLTEIILGLVHRR